MDALPRDALHTIELSHMSGGAHMTARPIGWCLNLSLLLETVFDPKSSCRLMDQTVLGLGKKNVTQFWQQVDHYCLMEVWQSK